MSFQQGLSGLNAAATSLNAIGHNIANANTVGFKASQAQFADVFAISLTGAGGGGTGIGTKVAAINQHFTQGSITVTSNPLDIAINGQGFFRLSDNGAISYTRNGQFQLDNDGFIVNNDGKRVTGYMADVSGVLNTATIAELSIPTSGVMPNTTTAVAAQLNLDSRKSSLPAAAFNMNDPATYHDSTSVAVYDSLGNAHTLSTYFVKTAPNEWSVFASANGAQIGAGPVGTLTFTQNGLIDTTATTLPFALTAPVGTGAAPLAFTLTFSGTTQFGSSFGVNALQQDGYTSGRLAGFGVDADGMLMGRYTNGQSNVLGQFVLANFTNPQGLISIGGTAWAESTESGAALVGIPQSGSLGVLQSSAVEDSNVDLTAELVSMITAQRYYQANAQTIKTQDAVLQTLVNLR
jgi:flagellar hook protein FlgE